RCTFRPSVKGISSKPMNEPNAENVNSSEGVLWKIHTRLPLLQHQPITQSVRRAPSIGEFEKLSVCHKAERPATYSMRLRGHGRLKKKSDLERHSQPPTSLPHGEQPITRCGKETHIADGNLIRTLIRNTFANTTTQLNRL